MKTFVLSTVDGKPVRVFLLPEEVDDSGPRLDKLHQMVDALDLELVEVTPDECDSLEEVEGILKESHNLSDEDFDKLLPGFDKTVEQIEAAGKLLKEGKTPEEAVKEVLRGWDHFDDPLEIEKVDEEEVFFSDDDASLAHRVECGCQWPEVDFQHRFMQHLEKASPFCPPVWAGDFHELYSMARERYAWPKNLERIYLLTAKLFAESSLKRMEDVINGESRLGFKSGIESAWLLLMKLAEDIDAERTTLRHAFTNPDDWEVCYECKKPLLADDAVFINPQTKKAGMEKSGGKPFHVECAPGED